MATANPGTVSKTGNPYLDSLLSNNKWDMSAAPITFSFGKVDSTNAWSSEEKIAVFAALGAWEEVANVSFEFKDDGKKTNFTFYLTDTLPGGAQGIGHGPNGKAQDGNVLFATTAFADWKGDLPVGGYSYFAAVHEIGHALGLEHPHDTAHTSLLFPGVTTSSDRGEHGLNNILNTVMGYNVLNIDGLTPTQEQHFGFVDGPMAFDIAAIQSVYGKNMSTNAGVSSYKLPNSNQQYTAWSCIWDAGNVDEIFYRGKRDSVIDLRDAPLTGKNAGGYISHADGIFGGYTIANGVVIENASGGDGSDSITGNTADNMLDGFNGDDELYGLGGDDLLDGGFGFDLLNGGGGTDTVTYAFYANSNGMVANLASGLTTFQGTTLTDTLVSVENLVGGQGSDCLIGNGVGNKLDGYLGNDLLIGGGGRDRLIGGLGQDTLNGNEGADIFQFTTLSHSSGGFMDNIQALNANEDQFDVSSANIAAGLAKRTVAADFTSDIYGAIGSAKASQLLLVTATGSAAGVYLFINDKIAAADWTKDALIKLTDMTGALTINDFI
jgi:serralysin